MIRKEFEIKRWLYSTIVCVHDEQFDIKLEDYNTKVNIYLKDDNRLIGSFEVGSENDNEQLDFICQANTTSGTKFYVATRSKENKKTNHYLKRYLFVDRGFDLAKKGKSSLHKECYYEILSTDYDNINLYDKAFRVGEERHKERILSRKTGKVSREFYKIYANDINPNIIFVERKVGTLVPEVCDYITYGIDPETLKVVTKIYSKNQDIFFDLLPDEEIRTIKKEIEDNAGYYYICLDKMCFDNQAEATISCMIKKPLCEEARSYENYTQDEECRIHPEFVKKLGTYTKEEN